MTYRYNEHTGPKKASKYDYLNLRELNYWKKNDPLNKLANYLINKKIFTHGILKNYENKVKKEISNSIKSAKLSKRPSYIKFIKEYQS